MPEEAVDISLHFHQKFGFFPAVLDYIPESFQSKIISSKEGIQINLAPTQKHIPEILKATGQCYSIGFKLESNVDLEQLLEKASSQISRYSMDAVVANRLRILTILILRGHGY